MEAGLEVVAPDAGVGGVVGDREVGTPFLQALRMRQRDRPEVLKLGERVAGDDQIAQVPVPAARQACREPPAGSGPAAAGGRQHDDRQGEHRGHCQGRGLGAHSHPSRKPSDSQRPTRLPLSIDEDGDGRKEQSCCHQVVLGCTRLPDDQRVALQKHAGCDQGERPPAIGPTDAPSCEEGHTEPAEVEEQAQRVSSREQDANGVQKLGVLRVKPVRENRLGVVDTRDRVAMRHFHRKRQVVPKRIEVEYAPAQCILGGQTPVREDERNHAHRHELR